MWERLVPSERLWWNLPGAPLTVWRLPRSLVSLGWSVLPPVSASASHGLSEHPFLIRTLPLAPRPTPVNQPS